VVNQRTESLPFKLPNGSVIRVQTTVDGPLEKDVSTRLYDFPQAIDAIEGLAEAVFAKFETIKPQSASVEFGLQVGAEAGQFMALLVKGTANANLKITLEWSKRDQV